MSERRERKERKKKRAGIRQSECKSKRVEKGERARDREEGARMQFKLLKAKKRDNKGKWEIK